MGGEERKKGGNNLKAQDQQGMILIQQLIKWKLGSQEYITTASIQSPGRVWKEGRLKYFSELSICGKKKRDLDFLNAKRLKRGVLTACLDVDKDNLGGWICNSLFQETISCSQALCGRSNMSFQTLTAGQHLGRVTASKSSAIIAEHLENNWAVHFPRSWGGETREAEWESKR